MPNIRIGFSSDFTLKNNIVGLGTTTGSGGKLDVDGVSKADYKITGIATLKSYGGFVAQKQHVNEPSTIGFATVGLQTAGVTTTFQYYETETGYTDLGSVHHGDDQYFNALSEDLVIDDGQILNITNTEMVGVTTIGEWDPHTHASYVCAGSLEQVSVTGHFSVPCGGINERKENPVEGTVRFNDDLATLEFFNGVEWRQFTYNQGQSGRGIRGGGLDPANLNSIDYITISSTGNAKDFGDLTDDRNQLGACASSTRGLFGGGQAPGTSDVIDYITIASAGNAVDFGNLTNSGRMDPKGVSSSTRGIFGGGFTPGPTTATNIIDYVEIPTVGNALDFGDLKTAGFGVASCGSPILGIFLGGNPARNQIIESITIASKGNSVDYGDCDTTQYASGCSNSVRGIFFGNSPFLATMQYLNITTNGNSSEFGDAHDCNESSACASPIRGVCMSGRGATSPNPALNNISYVEISSLGDAIDFGDLSVIVRLGGSLSDSHGGLGGF